jgi:hypothetical protein
MSKYGGPGDCSVGYTHNGVRYTACYDYYPPDETENSHVIDMDRVLDPAGNDVSRTLPRDVLYRMSNAALRQQAPDLFPFPRRTRAEPR